MLYSRFCGGERKISKKRTSPIWKISREDLVELVEKSDTMSEVLAFFGMKNKGGNGRTMYQRLKEDNIDYSKFKNNFGKGRLKPEKPLKEVMIKNSTYHRGGLKKRILSENLIEEKCAECGMGPEWNSKKLVLVLDHINGISNDHRLENLRFLCPNCNSQTDTFAGKNQKVRNIKYCPDCFSVIHKTSKKCSICSKKDRRVVERPNKEKLKQLLEDTNYSQVARKYGVSDNAVRKWAKSYGL